MKRLLLTTTFLVSMVFVSGAAFPRKPGTEGHPVVTKAVAPLYPAIARQAHASGKVVVEVKIDSHGKVVAAKAKEGHPLMHWAAEEGAKQWQFEAGTDGGVALLTFNFIVDNGESDKTSFIPPYEVEVVAHRPDLSAPCIRKDPIKHSERP